MSEQELIKACKKSSRKAQKILYERYAANMFGVCRRYIQNEADIEEILLSGFYKVFTKIDQFKGKGSLGGWMRRIIINEALMFLRKKKRNPYLQVDIDDHTYIASTVQTDAHMQEQDILKLLDKLPIGYRTVFNLYAIEGYGHKDIAKMLNISINTSKSQLLKARRMLQKLLQPQIK